MRKKISLPVDLNRIYRALTLKTGYLPDNDRISHHNDFEESRITNYHIRIKQYQLGYMLLNSD